MLGMGDIVGLVEASQAVVDAEEARKQQEKLAHGKFDLNDFRQEISHMKKMGPLKDIMQKIPGLNQMAGNLDDLDADGQVKRIQGIGIDSMTLDEPPAPGRGIDIPRRRRIAAGSGGILRKSPGLIKQFDAMAAMVKQIPQMTILDRFKAISGARPCRCLQPSASKPLAPEANPQVRGLDAEGTRATAQGAREGRTATATGAEEPGRQRSQT